ncbi:MAG: helix-turn-helix domain-containing protein [Nitrospirota bacterium]
MEKLLTIKEVSDLLAVKPKTLYSWAEQKLIPALKLNGSVRFEQAALKHWLEKQRTEYNLHTRSRQMPQKGGVR